MLLALLQIGDSAAPVGGAAHSFGLETLVEEGHLHPANLSQFLEDYLTETGAREAYFARKASKRQDLVGLNHEFEARRPAREAREATLKMGRRFVELFAALSGRQLPAGLHYPIAFGAAGGFLASPPALIASVYLQQSLTGLVSACQRLMPLGQVAASRLIWNLRPLIEKSAADSEEPALSCFTPLPELGSLRHGTLETRLFIS